VSISLLYSNIMMTAGLLQRKEITRFQFYRGTSNNLQIRAKRIRDIFVGAVPKGLKLSTFAWRSMDTWGWKLSLWTRSKIYLSSAGDEIVLR